MPSAITTIVLIIIVLLAGCVERPELETNSPGELRKEARQIDSLLADARVMEYARMKTLLRMSATISSSTSQLKATGQVVRQFADILDDPSLELLMQNPTVWFDAALEWDVAYKSVRAMNEDEYPSLLESCGESDFWRNQTETPWSASWEHLLLFLAWDLAEDREIAFYELVHVDPDYLGFNEYGVLACWLVSMKMDAYGYQAHANLYRRAAAAILMDPRFDPCGCLSVSWMGTAKQDVRASMMSINDLLTLASGVAYQPPWQAGHSAKQLMNVLKTQPKDRMSEFHVIADFIISRVVPEYDPVAPYNTIAGLPLSRQVMSPSKLSRVLFGAYLSTWIWENFMDQKVLSGLSGIPERVFRLINTLNRVGSELSR